VSSTAVYEHVTDTCPSLTVEPPGVSASTIAAANDSGVGHSTPPGSGAIRSL